ncbi:MAG: hypothetical protein M0009_15530 [Deltaproteobacteria bacterium]|nr:hypothetical protein [Deltaproteobacteria bacterium]
MHSQRTTIVIAIAAILFGAATVLSGGRALFGSPEVQAGLGRTVPFVLWFNFIAGFLYVFAGAGLWLRRPWAVPLSLLVAVATIVVFAAFGLYVLNGGAFEMRTVGALAFRALFWVAAAIVARHLLQDPGNGRLRP